MSGVRGIENGATLLNGAGSEWSTHASGVAVKANMVSGFITVLQCADY